jgi:hypothetical protein
MICAGGDDSLGIHCLQSVHIILVWNNIEFVIVRKTTAAICFSNNCLPMGTVIYLFIYYYYYFDLKNYQNFNTFYIGKKHPFSIFLNFFSVNRKNKIITIYKITGMGIHVTLHAL